MHIELYRQSHGDIGSPSVHDSELIGQCFWPEEKKHERESCFVYGFGNGVAMSLVSLKGDDVIKFHCDTNGFANSVVVVTGHQ